MKKTGSEQVTPAEPLERARLQAEVAKQRVRIAKEELKRAPRAKRFVTIDAVHTSGRGYFNVRVARRAGAYRFIWSDASGSGRSQALSVRH